MNTLENKVIIYDDVCPLCNAYTGCFLKLGWLRRRTGFTGADPAILDDIDLDRARHEIPLYDTKTRQTLYGLDALFLILGTHLQFLKPIFRNRFFRMIVKQLYQIITYNRRIIAGSRAPEQGFDCVPDVNRFYRWVYIGLVMGGSALMAVGNFPETAQGWYLSVAVLQLFILVFGISRGGDRLTFIGHWVTIGLMVSILGTLLPTHPISAVALIVLALRSWYMRRNLAFA